LYLLPLTIHFTALDSGHSNQQPSKDFNEEDVWISVSVLLLPPLENPDGSPTRWQRTRRTVSCPHPHVPTTHASCNCSVSRAAVANDLDLCVLPSVILPTLAPIPETSIAADPTRRQIRVSPLHPPGP
jgi:hypothetical protein